MKVMSPWTLLVMPAVIFKQRLLHEKEIMLYLQTYKYQDVNQSHF